MTIRHELFHTGPQHAGSPRPSARCVGEHGPARRRRPSLGTKILAGVLSAGTVCSVLACGSPNGSVTADVVPLSVAGADPFTPPVGRDNPDVAPLQGAGPQRASLPGLFAEGAGPDSAPVCDSAQLVDHLTADPSRATAWAQVFGISAAEIPAFARSLTPALLRADTAVIDHRYRDGRFVAAPAVLARGTAVFVSSYGQPTVKCFNGNPLTAPLGPPPSGTTTVVPTSTGMSTFVFSTVGGDTLPGRPAPGPVGPTPAQIAAAQQARADADAAVRKAWQARADADAAARTASQARVDADTAADAARDADEKANADFTAWFLAHYNLGPLQIDLDAAIAEAERWQRVVDNWPPFLGSVPAHVTQQLDDARDAQERAQAAYDEHEAEANGLQTARDESRAAAADAAEAAQDAEQIAVDAQTAAEQADAAARAAEQAAGLPSPATSETPSPGEANTPASLSTGDGGDAAGESDTGDGAETADSDDPGSESTTGTDGEAATAEDDEEGADGAAATADGTEEGADGAATAQDDEGGADEGDQAGGSTGGAVSDSGAGTHSSGDTSATIRD